MLMPVVLRASAAGVGVVLAALPSLAMAAGAEDRALAAAADSGTVLLLTALGVVAVLAAASLGYLYRRIRGAELEWEFQRPDPDDGHEQ